MAVCKKRCPHSWRQLSAFGCASARHCTSPAFPPLKVDLITPTCYHSLYSPYSDEIWMCVILSFHSCPCLKVCPLHVLRSQEWPISSGCPFLFCFPLLLTRCALQWWNMNVYLFSSCPHFFFPFSTYCFNQVSALLNINAGPRSSSSPLNSTSAVGWNIDICPHFIFFAIQSKHGEF